MVVGEKVTQSTEIRHLSKNIIQHLCRYLDSANMWKQLVEKIPTNATDKTPLYSSDQISIMQSQPSPTLALLQDWGTYGRKRPTVELLVNLLRTSQLQAVANYITVDVLHGYPELDTKTVDIIEPIDTVFYKPQESSEVNLSELGAETSKRVDVLGYEYLRSITHDFDEESLRNGGKKIGEGAFGNVYLGVDNDTKYAVKRLNIEYYKSFRNEVNLLSIAIQHPHIVTLFFASVSESYLCLGYEYMSNGSLQDRLARVDGTESIPWKQRLEIAEDVSKALIYIHSQRYIHRDVKSANILLDENWIAKLGDFGIAHTGPDRTLDQTSFITQNIIGTHVYMPHEAIYGVISEKLDTYSFGVVILELLTGLLPLNKTTNESLTEMVAVNCYDEKTIKPLLDKSAGEWNVDIADAVYKIATQCLETVRDKRPSMTEVLEKFQSLE